jgi:hypothetical protein
MRCCANAQDTVEFRLRTQAARIAATLIKQRARLYAKFPVALETICPGLSAARPEEFAAAARQCLAAERELRRRWFGAGGEIPLVNAKGALLLGRTLRRAKHKRIRNSVCRPGILHERAVPFS